MRNILLKTILFPIIVILFASNFLYAQNTVKEINWYEKVRSELPYLGHRNWILIVDAAYPLQSSDAIKTIIADDKIERVAKTVFDLIDKSDHIKPIVYQDKEFAFMQNRWSNDCEKLYDSMSKILAPYNPNVILHDDIFSKLDAASKLFNVLVIKTNCTTPYSSVFIELDCGYWDGESEKALRSVMNL